MEKEHKEVKCKNNKAAKKKKKKKDDFGEQFSKGIKIKNILICQTY